MMTIANRRNLVWLAAIGGLLALPATAHAATVDPSTVSGLVGWYDAQALSGADGTSVTTWSDKTGGTNVAANDLTQVTGDRGPDETQIAVAPTLQTVTLNTYTYRMVQFIDHTTAEEYELLIASGLVNATDNTRTIMTVYKGGMGGTDTRPLGFGSSLHDGLNTKTHWNLGTDGNGTSRFDGAKIDSGYSAGLNRSAFVIRTAVMESKTSFDEFIDVLDGDFADNQVLSNGIPTNALNDITGDFLVGDMHTNQRGEGTYDVGFEILEILVFDTALSTADRQGVQDYLALKYTTPEPATLALAAIGVLGLRRRRR